MNHFKHNVCKLNLFFFSANHISQLILLKHKQTWPCQYILASEAADCARAQRLDSPLTKLMRSPPVQSEKNVEYELLLFWFHIYFSSGKYHTKDKVMEIQEVNSEVINTF